MNAPRAQLDVGALLTLDVEAEVRKAAWAAVAGAWQVPAELVRLAFQRGARQVDLELRSGRLALRHDGALLDERHVAALRTVADARAGEMQRHAALVALEAAGLLALSALRPRRFHLEPGGRGFEVRGLRLDARRASAWLRAVCRFAPARVRVDGEELPRGFEQAIAEGALAFPLAGRVAIPAGHDEVRLWLLSAGVVRAHLTVPGVPAFEAFVDGDRLAGSGASAAALRDAVQPHVATIVDQAVGLLLEAAGTTLQRPAEHQRRLRAGLLLAARRRLRLRDVLAAPAFPALDGTSRAPRALSLLDVGREAARAPRFTLWALDPRTDPRDVVLPAETVLLLDPEERARLAEQLGVRFATPPAREVRGTWRRRLRARLDALGRTVRSLGSRLALAAGRLVPPEHTSAAERALIQALAVRIERGGEALEVAFTDGAGTARRRGRRPSRLLLPRRNPTVRAAVLALGRDPRWGYAAAVALCDEAGLESPALFVP